MKRIGTKYYFLIGLVWSMIVFSDLKLQAATYYVSNFGNDSNSGLTATQAWKTLTKVNRAFLKPGDQVLFNRGEMWLGTIKVNYSGKEGSPITFGAYGSGTNPVISGFTTVTGWTDEGGGIYSKTLTVESNPEIVTINGVQYAMGRTPNSDRYNPQYSDYYHIDAVTGDSIITDSECNAAVTDWDGAEIIIRSSNFWDWTRRTIVSHSGTTIYFGATTGNTNAVGFGYFIQNDIRTLDQFGEWYYGGGKFYMYFGTEIPTDYTVKVSTKDKLINVITKDFITVRNIKFEGASNAAITTNTGTALAYNLTVDNCNFDFNYTSIYSHWSPNLTITNCNILRSSERGIYNHWNSDGMYIANNIIDSTSLVLGAFSGEYSAGSGVGITATYSKLLLSANKSVLERNIVKNNGHTAIMFSGDSMTLNNNFIDKYCINRSDGGGLYHGNQTNHSGMIIDHNIILNGTSNNEKYGLPADNISNRHYNIYLDYRSVGGFKITNNTIAHSEGGGIMIHGSQNIEAFGNTVFDCEKGVIFQELDKLGFPTRDVIFDDNIIVAKTSSQLCLWARSTINDFNQYGTFTNNHYAKLISDSKAFATLVNTWKDTYRSFPEWQSYTGQDSSSTFHAIKLKKDETVKLLYNKTEQKIKYYLGKLVFNDVFGKQITDTFTLEPFTSKILIGKDFEHINQRPQISDQSFNITSPKLPTDSIGQLLAFDNDTNQVIKFSIVQGNEMNHFLIDSLSGGITINHEINTSKDLKVEMIIQVTDNSVNSLSDSARITIHIKGTDLSPPVINSFVISPLSCSLTVPVVEFNAFDDLAVRGYFLSEYPEIPDPNLTYWSSSAPLFYSFSKEGFLPLYAWAKDSAGNVSPLVSDTTLIIIPDLSPKFSYYPFEEGSVDSIFDSHDFNHGVITGEIIRGKGATGGGLSFTGSGYVNLGDCFSLNVQNEVSLVVWIKPTKVNDGEYQGIIVHGGPDFDSFGLYINPSESSIGFKTSGTSTPLVQLNNVNELWDGNWHQLVAVYNGSEKLIYLDGKLLVTEKASGQIDSGYGYELFIGAVRDEINSSLYFQGDLDEVRICNYTLGLNEIDSMYHSVNKKLNETNITEFISICEDQSYQGWTEPGNYIRVLQRKKLSASGADSIIITNLAVLPVMKTSELISILEGESYQGWTTAGIFERFLTTAAGCDSIITTYLTVAKNFYTEEYIEICEGENYEGHSNSSQFQRKLTSISGTDSIITTHLTVHPVFLISEEVKIREGENYQGWTVSGEYTRLLASVTGCDSVITTALTVEPLQNQFIDLKEGWNIFSSFLVPSKNNFDDVFEQLKNNNLLIEAQNENGKTYIEGQYGWVNYIGNLEESEGYKIRVQSGCVMEIKGQPVQLPFNIQLNRGLNMISFPQPGEADAMKVIQPLIDEGILEKVQDEKGNSIEHWGNSIGWINAIGNLSEGKGYFVQVNREGVLPVIAEYDKSGLIISDELNTEHFKKIYEGNGHDHMNVNIVVSKELNLQVGDEIAVYDDEKCVGAVILNDPDLIKNNLRIIASATDKDILNGFSEGNEIKLRVWQKNKNTEHHLLTEIIKGNLIFTRLGSVFVQILGIKEIERETNQLWDFKIYPNPAKDIITIEFSALPLQGTKILISNILGVTVAYQDVKSDVENVLINALSSGTYFLTVLSENKYITNKLIIQ